MKQSEWLVRQLFETAKRAETQTHEDIIRLKAKHEQIRQHRMELEAIVDAMKADPKDGDVQQAPLVSGAAPEGETP